jgi:thiamine biosynthesis lipoprotein
VDLDASTVRLPPGVSFDLGGIGKGRAADLIVARLLDDGVEGACVDLGGDVRVAGRAPDPEGWLIAVADPWDDDAEIAMLALADGAVTTSARTRRRWWFDGTEQHHLIDPVTGLPARSGLAAVTVVAAEAVWAEVVAKAAFVGGPDVGTSLIASSGAAGILVEDDHRVRRVGPVGRYVLESGVSPVNRGTRR